MNKQDLFYKLINEGILKISGLDEFKPYRIIEFQGKDFKLILDEVKGGKNNGN